MDNISEFSKVAGDILFSAFPEFSEYAQIVVDEEGEGNWEVEVPAPPEADAAYGLYITTSDDEITIGFDYYHTHCSDMAGDGEQYGNNYGLHYISEIMDERIAAVSWWLGEKWKGSTSIKAGVKPIPSEYNQPFDKVRIRSWRGSLNSDE